VKPGADGIELRYKKPVWEWVQRPQALPSAPQRKPDSCWIRPDSNGDAQRTQMPTIRSAGAKATQLISKSDAFQRTSYFGIIANPSGEHVKDYPVGCFRACNYLSQFFPDSLISRSSAYQNLLPLPGAPSIRGLERPSCWRERDVTPIDVHTWFMTTTTPSMGWPSRPTEIPLPVGR
jgi:hypothetical protein